jgi:hypothetical protein
MPLLLVVIGMYLGILFLLVRVTLLIDAMPNGAWHALARFGELFLGIALLLTGTVVATRLGVWLFQPPSAANQ